VKTFERKPTAIPCQPSPLVSSFPALETRVETSLISHHHHHLRAPSGLLVHLVLLAPSGLCPVFVGFLLVRAALYAEQSPCLLPRSNPPLPPPPPPPPPHVIGESPSSLPVTMHTKAAVAMRAYSICLAGVPDAPSSGAKNDLLSGGKVKVKVKAKAKANVNVNETPLPPPARHCSLRKDRVSHSPIHY
jgi:hypothetical protein